MRLVEPAGIAAAALWLPEGRSRADDAVREGRLRRRQAGDLGHEEIPVAEDVAPPDMAVRAARTALATAGVAPGDIGLTCHAWMYYQGHDLWSPAHYIAHRLGALRAVPVGVQQVCNGGSAAVELAAARLAAGAVAKPPRDTFASATATGPVPATDPTPTPDWALVTTADRFAEPGFDRWASDYGVAYADAGTAVLLRLPAAPSDALLLRSVASVAAPELEVMHRGADPFAPVPRGHRPCVDMRATKRAYLHEHGNEPFARANRHAIGAVVAEALDGTGLDPWDPRLRYAVLPRFGAKTLAESWVAELAGHTRAEPVDFGRTTGHLGAGDAAAGLADLVRRRALAPGESALVFSAGAGFTWSCLLVQAPVRNA
ncbi:3-oxoacyl-[acyl-carrier-protein] synthase III C-terminal domain-containing protein [Streptomyces sp. NPDC050617]|uniref:3-oxoacyl-[acyl-carrier-protein] synthase III C-terminal domain-containing protein n=1 Tax=Streptomyces sp. NPDC050617 TaxID=3154628 RepID=UPI00343B9DF8